MQLKSKLDDVELAEAQRRATEVVELQFAGPHTRQASTKGKKQTNAKATSTAAAS